MVVVNDVRMNKFDAVEYINDSLKSINKNHKIKNVEIYGNPYNRNVYRVCINYDEEGMIGGLDAEIHLLEYCTENVIDYIVENIDFGVGFFIGRYW